MSTWILVIVMTSGTGKAVATQEFQGKFYCEKAAKDLSGVFITASCYEDKADPK